MRHLRFRRPSHATVIAYLALFVALGGTAMASVIITSNSQVANNTISGHKPPSGKHPNIIGGSVNGTDLATGAVSSGKLADGAVTASKLACEGSSGSDVMVKAGSVCIDKYENSIWTARTGGTRITGAIPCAANGQNCKGKIFARSVAGVTPRANITWFQAQQALANSGKSLPTNAEWQQAVAGTPEGQCNTSDGVVRATGSFTGCVSDWGAYDMVGNLWEWVGDWDEQAGSSCANWSAGFGGDLTCLGRGSGEASTHFPGALVRGGGFDLGVNAGPFSVDGRVPPSASLSDFGFRGAR
jgi:Sulfatase-modifying factor enzyme 1